MKPYRVMGPGSVHVELRFREGDRISASAHSVDMTKKEHEHSVAYLGDGFSSDTGYEFVVNDLRVEQADPNRLLEIGADRVALSLLLRRCSDYVPLIYRRNVVRGEQCPNCGAEPGGRSAETAHEANCAGRKLWEDIKKALAR
jgi:hypothetical protein